MHANAPSLLRAGLPEPFEAVLLEPAADGGEQVWRLPVPGPDGDAAFGAQLCGGCDRTLNVLVFYVAENAAQQKDLGRREAHVVVGERGIALSDLDLGE